MRACLAVSFATVISATALAQESDGLTRVTDDVWRFDTSFWVTFVALTGDGAVVGDPISARAAEELERLIDQRFGVPVTHMVISHHHGDHASGGAVFADEAEVVASKNFTAEAAAAGVSVPPVDIAVPQRGNLSLEIGKKTFEFVHLPQGGHSNDLIVTLIRPDNVAVVVDIVWPRRLPWRQIRGERLDAVIDQIEMIEGLDFEIMLPGHGPTGTRQDATEQRIYLETLRDRVQAGLDDGLSASEIVSAVTMPEYASWLGYIQPRPANVRSMIDRLTR